MAEREFKSIAVVGVGLLGGSLGLAAKAASPAVRIIGIGHRRSSLDEALAAGVVDETTTDVAAGVRSADLVVLCTPVGLFADLLKRLAPAVGRGAVVTDVGSTKAAVVRSAERLLAGRAAFVGSHPIAGAETRGVAYARADLYQGRTCVLTPTPRTAAGALRRVEQFWQSLGMLTVRLSPTEHDKALANLSHLPHALAALLVLVQDDAHLDLAGTGFLDTTRIAGGDPVMWRDIFLSNRQAVLRATDLLGGRLEQLRRLVDSADGAGIEGLLAEAQQRRAKLIQRRLRQGRIDG